MCVMSANFRHNGGAGRLVDVLSNFGGMVYQYPAAMTVGVELTDDDWRRWPLLCRAIEYDRDRALWRRSDDEKIYEVMYG